MTQPHRRAAAWRTEWVDQPKEFLSEHLNGHWDWRVELRIRRAMRMPRLSRQWRSTGTWAVSVVHNEVDIIAASIQHHLDQGIDHVLVADHLSTDGTRELLQTLAAADHRIHVALDSEPGHYQKEKVSLLSRAAWSSGARWVIPFDADEFWFARGRTLAEALAEDNANVISAQVMTLLPCGTSPDVRDDLYLLSELGASPAKVAFRSHPLALVGPGNHGAARVGAMTTDYCMAHLPLRGPEQFTRKYGDGATALRRAGAGESEGWHWHAGAAMTQQETARAWQRMLAGAPMPAIGWPGVDPTRRVQVLRWPTWDPDGVLRGETPR